MYVQIACIPFQNIKEEMRRREEELRQSTQLSDQNTKRLNSTNRDPNIINNQDGGGIFGGAMANILVIIGFAVFAYTVKLVLKSVVE